MNEYFRKIRGRQTQDKYRMKVGQGGCVFQDDDHLCSIQKKLGFNAKPAPCKRFPYILTSTPGGIIVGLSYVCTAVQQNIGNPLSQQGPTLDELEFISDHDLSQQKSFIFFKDLELNWETYLVFEKSVLKNLKRPQKTPSACMNHIMLCTRGFYELLKKTGTNSKEKARVTCENLDTIKNFRDGEYSDWRNLYATGFVSKFLQNMPEETQEVVADEELYIKLLVFRKRQKKDKVIIPDEISDFFKNYLYHVVWRKFLIIGNQLLLNLILMDILANSMELYFLVLTNSFSKTEALKKVIIASEKIFHHSNLNLIEDYLNNAANSFIHN